MPSKPKRPVLPPATKGDYSMVYPFSEEEYRKGVAILKNNIASGRDEVLVEQLNNLGPKADNAKQILHGKKDLPYLPYPTLQFSEKWARGRKLMACLTSYKVNGLFNPI